MSQAFWGLTFITTKVTKIHVMTQSNNKFSAFQLEFGAGQILEA